MVKDKKRKVSTFTRFLYWIDSLLPQKTMTEKIEDERTQFQKDAADAEKVIVNHQYLLHMARAQIRAVDEWNDLQAVRAANSLEVSTADSQ